ncbi:MAG: C13 family peptidase, partial [Steroidobacter sp.]
ECGIIAVRMQPLPPDTDSTFVQPAETPATWRTAFRLLTLRSVEPSPHALSGRIASIVWLALLALGLWIGLGWISVEAEAQFYPYSLPALSFCVLAMLVVAATMVKGSRSPIELPRVCRLLAILLPVLILADFAITLWVPEQWIVVARVGLGLYALVYCARGLHALTGDRQPVAALGGLVVVLICLWLASALYIYPVMWIPEHESNYDVDLDADRNISEELLFGQPARIDASAARIERPLGEAPVGFFVGFAGYGEQKVFAEEIKFAAEIFEKRYDTSERTLLLLNDQRDREVQPLATVSGLRYALKAVASKMRIEQDVLFLVLSSHGSDDPLLSVSNGTLPLRDLTGSLLTEALRESGIKWRVIVISACHSGAFIESLRNPYTIVITAAAPERTSFGCSDDRDLTYFGEALFRDSLPQASSLREAFNAASQLVDKREREEGFKPSRPQAFFGQRIEQKLVSMTRVPARAH